MKHFCPLCQEWVEIGPVKQHLYRLTPKKHKCTRCEPHCVQGIQGWRPKKVTSDGP